jgi:hypothetical protein
VDSLDPHSKGKFEEYRRSGERPLPGSSSGSIMRREPEPGLPVRGASQVSGTRVPGSAGPRRGHGISGSLGPDPTTYSTTGRSRSPEASRGVFTLPNPRPTTAEWNVAPYLSPTRTRWDPVRWPSGSPFGELELQGRIHLDRKVGDRPLGVAYGSPGAISARCSSRSTRPCRACGLPRGSPGGGSSWC